jgi:hypothetical protein
MVSLRLQSQSLASPISVLPPISPQDEGNSLRPLGVEYLNKLLKNFPTFDPIPGQPNDTEMFIANIEYALGSDRVTF